MNDKRNLSGHPWHIGYLKMDEDDKRRDKRKCIYFLKNESYSNYCKKKFMNCIGSSHCSFYEESDVKIKENYLHIKKTLPEEFKEVKKFDVKIFEDDIYSNLVKIFNSNIKTPLKFIDIPIVNLKSYEIIGQLRCLTTINGNIFYLICKSDFERIVIPCTVKDTNLSFQNMDLELIRDFLKNLTMINHQNRRIKIFNDNFVDKFISRFR